MMLFCKFLVIAAAMAMEFRPLQSLTKAGDTVLVIWLYCISETVRPWFVCKLFLLQKEPSVLTISLALSFPFAIHSEKTCDVYLPCMVKRSL